MRNKRAVFISGSSGVGKTQLAKRYSNVLDLDCAPFSKSPDWPKNYLDAINKNLYKYDYVLIFTRFEKFDLDYEFVFPSEQALPEYKTRLEARGGKWVELAGAVYKDYDSYLKLARSFGKKISLLGEGGTLESFLLSNKSMYPTLIHKV